ncbi:MAG: hypothetical protein LUP00_03945, partial [Methanothrix sp.]|nr:hypothetical protein [Methanothrix sp.]
ALQRQIAAKDRQIDALVYELYGLTEEEIAIVEGAQSNRKTDLEQDNGGPRFSELHATCSHHDGLALRASIEILPINKINEPFLHIRKYG